MSSRSSTVVLRFGSLSRRTTARALGVHALLAAVMLGLVLWALVLGDRPMTATQVLGAFLPGAEELDRMVVVRWRAPRAVAAVVFGAALGLSGAVFQSLTRNPMGSPDVIGLNTGAFTGVMTVLLLGGVGFLPQMLGSLLGGLGAALLVYVLALRGGIRGFRLIIVGIGISAMLASVNTWLTVKAEIGIAQQAAVWGAGTLSGLTWPVLGAVTAVVTVLLLPLPLLGQWLRQLELGDDAAAALGIPSEAAKTLAVIIGVALTALVTSAAGPIAFIALAAPQIARRLSGAGSVLDLVGAALVGAVLLSASDIIAQHAIPGLLLPAGAVTVCIGGAYLVWLLLSETGRS